MVKFSERAQDLENRNPMNPVGDAEAVNKV